MDEYPRPLFALNARQPIVTLVAVALEIAPAEALEKFLGMGATAAGGIPEQDGGRVGAAMTAVIRGDRPEEALLRASASRRQHRRGVRRGARTGGALAPHRP